MSSKKKPRPLFEVPADIESAGESGWVYRSNGHADRIVARAAEESCGSIVENGAVTLALGMAAVTSALVLGLSIAAIPWTLGLRTAQAYSEADAA